MPSISLVTNNCQVFAIWREFGGKQLLKVMAVATQKKQKNTSYKLAFLLLHPLLDTLPLLLKCFPAVVLCSKCHVPHTEQGNIASRERDTLKLLC